jgi:hypothetical protein
MAAVKGDVGKVMFHNSAGTEADIAGTRSWTLDITKDTIETTVQGDTSKTFVGGLISGTGTIELIYDNAGNSDYQAIIDDVLTTGDPADALFELFPDSAQASKKIGFSGIITGGSFGASLGDLQTVNLTFQTSGAITSAV